jgi:hypothetical protein
MKEKVTSSKKNTVITLSDEVTELSSIKCTVDNWKVILLSHQYFLFGFQSFHRYVYFFAAIHWTSPRLSLIVLSPQPQYRWILHFHTSGVKGLRIKYNRVIETKTGDILANIDEVKDIVIKHLNEVSDKMKEKVTSSKKNTVIRLFSDMNRVLNRRKIQHLLEIHIETCWVQRSLTTFLVSK